MALMSALVAPGKPGTRAIAERHLEELFEPLDFFQVCHCSVELWECICFLKLLY